MAGKVNLTPAAGSDPGNWSGTYVEFVHTPEAGRKTTVWAVTAKDGSYLGRVSWFGRWRKYCFFPAPDCVFEETCLREIAQFIVDRTKEHRAGKVSTTHPPICGRNKGDRND